MKEEKDSILPFRRKSTNRLSFHLDRKKEKKEDGQLKRASWSSFPLLRFSSSSSTSSSSSSSPMAQGKRGLGRKCNSSEEIKHLSNKNSPPKVNFQRGSNASIRSSVSTSSASSTSSGVRTGGSSSITSILEGSGSDTFSCDSYSGNAGEFHPYPVNRTASEVIHPKRHDSSFGHVTKEGRDECLSMPSLGQGSGKGNNNGATSPRILYAHRKAPDVKHRSRKQLEKELETVRRTGSLPGGLETRAERSFDVRITTSTPVAGKTKPKHKKSFSFIHNSKFLGRLEARTRREGKPPCETETDRDYRTGVGHSDKQTTTSSSRTSVSLHHQESPPAHLRLKQQHSSPSRLPRPSPSPPSPLRLGDSPKSAPSNSSLQKHHSAGSPHIPSPPIYVNQSPSPKVLHRSPGQSSLSPPQNQGSYHHYPLTRAAPTPKPPPPAFFQHTDGVASSPPQFSLAAFLNFAFGSGESGVTTQRLNSPTSPQPPTPPRAEPESKENTQLLEAFNPKYLERRENSVFLEAFNPRYLECKENTQYLETLKPRYLETSFDSPLDFVTERNYANLRPEIRDIRHQVLLNGKDPSLPLSRSEYGDLELKQSFLGVIGDTIEEEEEEGAESECEIGELLCQVDSTCFERSMEDKLEEMAGKMEEDGDAKGNAAGRETAKQGQGKGMANKRPDLKLKLIKPENDMVKRVQKSRLLRHISEEGETVNSGGEEDVELRTPSTPRSPAIDIDNAFQQKQREIAEDKDEMSRLRDLTTRLQLTTRRPSYLDWAAVLKERGRRVGEAIAAHTPTVVETGGDGQEGGKEGAEVQLVEEEGEVLSMDRRKHNLQTAVNWVKKELTDMRQQDQQLARQLLQLRVEVQRLRLLHSCLATSCLLEEVAFGAEEAKMMEASDLCDLPPDLRDTFSPVLREMGLTRMNITSRRFSLR